MFQIKFIDLNEIYIVCDKHIVQATCLIKLVKLDLSSCKAHFTLDLYEPKIRLTDCVDLQCHISSL
jgi:hypothetical protein